MMMKILTKCISFVFGDFPIEMGNWIPYLYIYIYILYTICIKIDVKKCAQTQWM